VVGEVEDNDGLNGTGSAPAVNSKHQGAGGDDLRELYRRTIAANWTCLPGELSADKVVEDIFSGGDGWLSKPPVSGSSSGNVGATDDDGHGNHGTKKKAGRPSLFFSRSRQDVKKHSKENLHGARVERQGGVRGRGGFEHQENQMGGDAEKGGLRNTNEFDELDVRDDLRSWKLPMWEA
jgi:hypothetical protein